MIPAINLKPLDINKTRKIDINWQDKQQSCFANNTFNAGISNKYSVSFGSTTVNGWDKKDIDKIKKLLKNYKYGKDIDFLLEHGFKIRKYMNGVEFIYPDSSLKKQKYSRFDIRKVFRQNQFKKGICHNLAIEANSELNDIFKDKYNFQIVIGNSKKYFSGENATHYFLVGWPKELGDYVLHKDAGKKKYTIPEEAIIIDPSFNFVGRSNDYTVRELSDEEDIQEITGNLFVEDGTASPIGYLPDLITRADWPAKSPIAYDKNPILYEMYLIRDGQRKFTLGVQPDENSTEVHKINNWRNLIDSLPSNNKLKQYINAITQVVPPYEPQD